MKAYALVTAALMIASSSLGCCCVSPCVSPGDPCARELCQPGCSILKWLHHKPCCLKCKSHCGYKHGMPSCDNCGTMGYDAMMPMTYGAMPAASDCGCGQSHAQPMAPHYPPPAPMPVPPASAPAATPAVPAAPMENGAPPFTSAAPTTVPTQQVSYEEFHRLPGVVVSGQAPVQQARTPYVPPVGGKPMTWAAAK